MLLDRRNFFKILGATGVALTTGQLLNAAPPIISDKEFSGILYDSFLCVGCQECEKGCAKANNLPEPTDELKANVTRKLSEKQRTVINTITTSKGESYQKKQCMHCAEPACAAACLTQAMYKTKEGPVIWRGDKCMGCRYCMVSCPFDIPKFEYHSANPKIEKCTMCYESRLKNGIVPACVEICPAGALKFGTRRELIKEARKRIAESPKDYNDYIYGEHEAGGTSFMSLTAVPYKELKLKAVQLKSYPEMTKGFLYSVPSVFVLWPAILLGIYSATKDNHSKTEEHE